MNLAVPQLNQRIQNCLESCSKRLSLLRLGPGVTGQTPGSIRRAPLPAVVAICCRRPAGGPTVAGGVTPPPQLGLAHNTPPQDTGRSGCSQVLQQLQVCAGPTDGHPCCGSPSRGHNIQQIQTGYQLYDPAPREAGLPLWCGVHGSGGMGGAALYHLPLITYSLMPHLLFSGLTIYFPNS